ncbi:MULTISPECIES: hypothetical protein [Chelativorans]|jgi:hypothetical protein|uniref:Uncharacterized protein n=1 Tax=Chelativorans sp. (strain BNC1) TaxID=266779 RepID=Q11BU3_CHESB|nr:MULTISPECIES: hypothetical protein [Chelativorans]
MIVQVSAGKVALFEPDDFRKFKVTLDSSSEDAAANVLKGPLLRLEGTDTAWVDIESLVALSGKASEDIWVASLQRMIEGARAHGWISADGKEIRAHIERV